MHSYIHQGEERFFRHGLGGHNEG